MKLIHYDDILKHEKRVNQPHSVRNKEGTDFFSKVSSEISNPAINRDSMVFYSATGAGDATAGRPNSELARA